MYYTIIHCSIYFSLKMLNLVFVELDQESFCFHHYFKIAADNLFELIVKELMEMVNQLKNFANQEFFLLYYSFILIYPILFLLYLLLIDSSNTRKILIILELLIHIIVHLSLLNPIILSNHFQHYLAKYHLFQGSTLSKIHVLRKMCIFHLVQMQCIRQMQHQDEFRKLVNNYPNPSI